MTLHLRDSTKLVHQNVALSLNHYSYVLLFTSSRLLTHSVFSAEWAMVALLTQVIWKYMMSFTNGFSK